MKKLIKICLWILAFVPLFVNNSNSVFFPFVTEKNIFLRGVLIVISVLFIFNFFYNKKFREQISEKTDKFLKHPLVVSIFAFVFVLVISTIFAVNKYSAFWGTTNRAEGLTGIIFYFSFFIFSLLIFERKDWFLFFKLSLLTSFVMLFEEFRQFLNGVIRPGSFAGNPTFLAGYLLFSIFCSLAILSEIIPSETARARSGHLSLSGWKSFSAIILVASVLGIFIAQTRGTIIGLAIGIVGVLIYAFFRGKDINFWKLNLRKLSALLLSLLVLFSFLFVLTRKSEVWQKVPGFSRVSVVSEEDATTATRLILAKLSLQAVNPAQNGWKKLLIGWGPENFSVAYYKYFNPAQYKYELSWFDRAHNELLDRLVMNGLFGLLAYLSIWFFYFQVSVSRKVGARRHLEEFSLLNAALLLFGISFFVHLLFIFDQITTFIPFFAVLAFAVSLAVYDNTNKKPIKKEVVGAGHPTTIGAFFSILAIFLCFVFFRNDLPAYMQMKEYLFLRKTSNAEVLSQKIDTVFEPFTTAQADIRNEFLTIVSQNYVSNNKYMVSLLNTAFFRAEEYANKVPLDLKFSGELAHVYMSEGSALNNPLFLSRGEVYFRRIMISAPNIPSFNYDFALDLYYQNKYDESFGYFEKTFNANPDLYTQGGQTVGNVYNSFVKYFYQQRDRADFFKVAQRLKENGYVSSVTVDQVTNYLEKYSEWPKINFN